MKKESRNAQRFNMLEPFAGIDLCACGVQMKCEGECRKQHTRGGKVECPELYQIHIRTSKKGERRVVET